MKEPLVSAPGPIRELLDDFARMPEARRTFVAGTISVLLHALIFLGGGLAIISLGKSHSPMLVKQPEKKRLEVVLITPTPPPEPKAADLSKEEDALLDEKFRQLPDETRREHKDVAGLARKKNMSKRALFESWDDSVAGSRLTGKGDAGGPTMTGVEMKHALIKTDPDGSSKPDEILRNRSSQLPIDTPDSQPIFKPQPVSQSHLSDTQRSKPIPKVAEVAKVHIKVDQFAATPPPSRLLLATSKAEPVLKKVREANSDEIAMFIDKPKPKNTSDLDLRPPPPSAPEQQEKPPAPEPTPAPTPEPAKPQPKETVTARVTKRPENAKGPSKSDHPLQTRIDGGALPPGENGVDAATSIAGKFRRGLSITVNARWSRLIHSAENAGKYSAGETTLLIAVDARGKITRIKTTENTSNPAHAELCERAVFDSQGDFEPPPSELLTDGSFVFLQSFILF